MICKMRNDNKVLKEKELQDNIKYQQALYNDIHEYRNPIFETKKNQIYNDSIRIHKKRLNKYNLNEDKVINIDDNNNLEFYENHHTNNIKNESNSKNKNLNTDKIEKNSVNNKDSNTKSSIDLGITSFPRRRQSFDNSYKKNHNFIRRIKIKITTLRE